MFTPLITLGHIFAFLKLQMFGVQLCERTQLDVPALGSKRYNSGLRVSKSESDWRF